MKIIVIVIIVIVIGVLAYAYITQPEPEPTAAEVRMATAARHRAIAPRRLERIVSKYPPHSGPLNWTYDENRARRMVKAEARELMLHQNT